MSTWAIVVAAGAGLRFGGPKQFERLAGARVVDRSVRAALAAVDAVVVVHPASEPWDGPPVAAAVPGGATRAASVRSGLAAVPSDCDLVVVHDAARPLASPALFAAVIEAVRAGATGAVPALPIGDTIKRVSGGQVIETVPRDALVLVQTPQAFRADTLRAAHAPADDASDDAALVERVGGTIVTVPGDPANLKVTTRGDFLVAAALLDARPSPDERVGPVTPTPGHAT